MAPPEGREHNYGVQGDDDDEPLFASDGDVGVIANRLVRHALDALSTTEIRVHPEPAYFIGLRKGWIFDHPFDTHPVIFGPTDRWVRIPGFADSHSNGTRTVIPGCADKVRAGC